MISPNRKVNLAGVRHVQGIVENCNSLFQQFDHENDQGNDCYIEFTQNAISTNYGVFAQIKSGESYMDGIGYKIPADKEHLDYWSQSVYKSIGIVFDPKINKAFWVDISAYIKAHPEILSQKSHVIRVSSNADFSEESFERFKEYCFQYKNELQSYENYGRSLELFANIDNPEISYEGLKALYSAHRGKPSTWFYIISSFGKIREEGIRRNILGLISNYAENPNVFWHASKMKYHPSREMQQAIQKIVSDTFGMKEVTLLLPYMREGISRGSFSYLVFLVLDFIKEAHIILKALSSSDSIGDEDRNFCFWLYMHMAKRHSVDETLVTTEEYLRRFPFGYEDEAIIGVRDSIKEGDLTPVGIF